MAVGVNVIASCSPEREPIVSPSGTGLAAGNGSDGAIARVIVSGTLPASKIEKRSVRLAPTGTAPKSSVRGRSDSRGRPRPPCR